MRKLTVQRIGLRQAHALSTVRARRNEFNTYNLNRKNRSNVKASKDIVGHSFVTGDLSHKLGLPGKSLSIFRSQFGKANFGDNLKEESSIQ